MTEKMIAKQDKPPSDLRDSPAQVLRDWTRHRPAEHLVGQYAITAMPPASDDIPLVERIITAYRAMMSSPMGAPDPLWLQSIAEMNRPVHDRLIDSAAPVIADMLRNPIRNNLFYGFENLTARLAKPRDANWCERVRQRCYDTLLRVAEAVGVVRLEYPEAPKTTQAPEPEAILEALDGAFGFRIQFPNPFPDETGLATSRGIPSFRAIQALYQAYRIHALVGPDARVVEIGAGLGRTAFFARQFGIQDYTIIDIPLTCVAQGYFLGRALGEDAVSLFGEGRGGIRILPPAAFLDAADRYDLAVNVDSLTEMTRDTAQAYCQAIQARAGKFLSINHEYNAFTVREVCASLGLRAAARTPYWLRRGYVDEIFDLPPSRSQAHAQPSGDILDELPGDAP